MQQLLAACGHQLAGASHGGQVVLLQQGSRLLQLLLQGARGLQLRVIPCPHALPVDAEGTQPNHRKTKTRKHSRADAMQPGQKGRLTLDPPGGEGALQNLQGHGPSTATAGPIFTARGADPGAVR